jgi:hypothetical protein
MQTQVFSNYPAAAFVSQKQALEPVLEKADFSIRLANPSDSRSIAAVHYQALQTNFGGSNNESLTCRSLDQLEQFWVSKF